ncbi:transcription factor Jra [Anopheles ziemanni]|uniref:transcription factor Jra n=1 Tax=Anopheles coustani TaxID=139045 RepID=UPI00265AA9F5|nr:transcription factor Jra [Anopheles coustani]XP_058167818.1 transcription factor Jra [Anopheles ziemanni]
MRNNVLSSKNTNNNNTMGSFYEDNNAQFVPSSASGASAVASGNGLKRPATLELNPSAGKARRTRFNASVTVPSVLPSPDMQLLKLVSPELEKIISHNAALPTPTPGAIIFPPSASAEQQQFAKGFEDALMNIHKKDTCNKLNTSNNNNSSTSNNNNNSSIGNSSNQQPTSIVVSLAEQAQLCPTTTATSVSNSVLSAGLNGMSGGEMTYTNLDSYPGLVKEEPQATSANQSPPVSPIDMESQERIKLERKRLRNRVAASKCRRRKLERISKLEDKVKELKTQNSELGSMVCNLKQHIFQLKQQVLEHHKSGCTITLVGKF